ncbi:unnamed protein product [Closterium sp. Yama58-4]|nr:unnamed protein product [Closterium sp. Yama58-4]
MGTPQYRRENILNEILTDCGKYFDNVVRGETAGEGEEEDNLDQHGPVAEDTGPPPDIDAELVAVGAMVSDGVRIRLANERQSVTDGERRLMNTDEPHVRRESAREILRGMREAQQRAADAKIQLSGSEAIQHRGEGESTDELAMALQALHLPVENDEQDQGHRAECENRLVYQRRAARTKKYDQGREAREEVDESMREEQEHIGEEEECKREERKVEREKEEKWQREEEERKREEARKMDREKEEKRQREEEERKREEARKVEREKEEKRQREEEGRKREETRKVESEKEEQEWKRLEAKERKTRGKEAREKDEQKRKRLEAGGREALEREEARQRQERELQAPFRGVRRFLYVALGMAADIATVITIPRFILAVQGGLDAPDLLTTGGKLAIDLGGEGAMEGKRAGKVVGGELLVFMELSLCWLICARFSPLFCLLSSPIFLSSPPTGGTAMVGLYLWEQRREEEHMVRLSFPPFPPFSHLPPCSHCFRIRRGGDGGAVSVGAAARGGADGVRVPR